jgi:exoribonuclease R
VASPRVTLAVDDAGLQAAFAAIRAELKIPDRFDEATSAEAETAAQRGPSVPSDSTVRSFADRRDIAFITIDPEGSRDLDQAYAAERTRRGFRVWYAIADVASFVAPGGALDATARARGATMFAPDERAPLHPTVLNEGAASLLAGAERPAVLWTIELDRDGSLNDARVERAIVRSREQLSYPEAQRRIDDRTADTALALLADIGAARLDQERARGAVSLTIPTQNVVRADGHYALEYEQSLPVEKWNAQVSLMTGMAAARIMLDGGIGLLRTMPEPRRGDIEKLRVVAKALDIEWPIAMSYPDRIRTLDHNNPRAAAFMTQAARLLRGAGYLVVNDAPPANNEHGALRANNEHGALRANNEHGALRANNEHGALAAPYAHVTAPLRRVVDRFANEIVLSQCAGTEVPEWTRAALDELPAIMMRAQQRQRDLDRAVHDLLEAVTLAPAIGRVFDARVTDVTDGVAKVQLCDDAILGEVAVERSAAVRPGDLVALELVAADPARRSITFTLHETR